jgi:hypothetical protein
MAESTAAKRDRLLAALGLTVNLLGFGAIALAIASPDPLHSANLVLALAAGLPAASTGTVACGALLLGRRWGMVLALVALALQLLAVVPYGIVRTALGVGSRGLTGTVTGLWLAAVVLLIIYWALALARPSPSP